MNKPCAVMVCYGIIMVRYGVIMMSCDVIEDLKKYDVTGLEWLCKEPNRAIKSQRYVYRVTDYLMHEKRTKVNSEI